MSRLAPRSGHNSFADICGYFLHAIKAYPFVVGPALASFVAKLRYQVVVKKVRISNKRIYLTSTCICLFYFILYFFIWPFTDNYFKQIRIIQICNSGDIDHSNNISPSTQLKIFVPVYGGLILGLYYYAKLYVFIWKSDAAINESVRRTRKNSITTIPLRATVFSCIVFLIYTGWSKKNVP